MNSVVRNALKRAKALLGENPEATAPSETASEAFDKLATEARAYLASNAIADDVSIEIKFSKDDFEISFERS